MGTLKDLRRSLAALEVFPSKELGQNFLADPELARSIVDLLRIGEGEAVVEIGPGLGALSDALAESGAAEIHLVEKDRRLAAHLAGRYGHRPGPPVAVHAEDALRFDLRRLFPRQPVKLIGNLPYSTGTEILRRFLAEPTPVSEAVIMLQREVVDRITAGPGSKIYGPLSVRVQACWRAERRMDVPPERFHPRPAVHSTVLHLRRRLPSEREPFDFRWLDRLVRLGFGQRRKQLRKLLSFPPGEWERCAELLGLASSARAEELEVETWLELTRLSDPHPLKAIPQSADEIFDVVDPDDRVVGRERRAVVHADNLLHRAVHVFVFNSRGELFLQKRSHLKDSHPGRWDSSASGHLDSGETYEQAAVRELEEELGLSGAEPEPLGKIPPSRATGWEHVALFRAAGKKNLRYPCSEIETGGYFPPDLIEEWIARRPADFATGFLECWRRFRERSG